jgi:hypothetical protein
MNTPGKRTPLVKRASRHKMTRARIAAAALAKMAAGEAIAATALWSRIEIRETRPIYNQRQLRKQRRQRHAAGDRRAFK